MAITRRQFVTRLSTLAVAVGLSQTDVGKLTEAFAHGAPWSSTDWTSKPKVIWVHGAECTGCSTSLLSLFEDVRGEAVVGSGISTARALAAIGTGSLPATTAAAAAALYVDSTGHPWGHRTLQNTGQLGAAIHGLGMNANAQNAAGSDFNGATLSTDGLYAATIADVLIDFLDVQYHETIMAAGGDLAYQTLNTALTAATPFVLVVEGAVQNSDHGGYWNVGGDTPWCSIAKSGAASANVELAFDDVVYGLATNSACVAILPIGQCATFGGYPACSGPGLQLTEGGSTRNQTGAQGVYDFLKEKSVATSVLDKVTNSPGCPTNPWWFVLTVVLTLLDVMGIADLTAKDKQHRISGVYGTLLHGKYCPRYASGFAARVFASKPGDAGCLKNIGCKGLSTRTLCGRHGWNAQQPQNAFGANDPAETAMYAVHNPTSSDTAKMGTNCINAGHPCMGCTEKGYPDAFAPFVVR